MDSLLSTIGVNFDENTNVTQDHVNQLFAGVAPLLEKYHQDNPLTCDIECQENLESRLLYDNYVTTKDTLLVAPQEFENAEKAYLTYAQGGAYYVNFKEAQAKEQVAEIIQILSNNFEQKYSEVEALINSLEAQTISEKYIKDLEDSYGRDINQIDREITDYETKNNINDRLSVYYNRRIHTNKNHTFYIRILYWALVMAYFFYFFIFQQLYREKKNVIMCSFLLFTPLLIKPLITWLFPIKIYIPPAPPVCPPKPAAKIPPAPPAGPPAYVPSKFVPPPAPSSGPSCPAPSVWSILKNSLPSMGIPNARNNIKEKATNFHDTISWQMSKMAGRLKKIV